MSEYSSSETSVDDSYSDSEGTYTLTTTSDSGDEVDVETIAADGTVVHEKGEPVCKNGGLICKDSVAASVTPEPVEFLIHPSNTATYEIKTKGGRIILSNGGLSRATSPSSFSSQTSGSRIVSARTWNPSTSSNESKADQASKQLLAFSRLRQLPVIRCAAAAYTGVKATKFVGWAISVGEACARMAVAPVTVGASPFAYMCSVPINCVDRALCKGLDIAEVLFPCIVMHPCQMCWGMKTYLANGDAQD